MLTTVLQMASFKRTAIAILNEAVHSLYLVLFSPTLKLESIFSGDGEDHVPLRAPLKW